MPNYTERKCNEESLRWQSSRQHDRSRAAQYLRGTWCSRKDHTRDRDTGRSRGFGFVEMTNASEADKAIAALNGSDLGGRTLTINEARPKSERLRGCGQRFGGGGGRGRDDYSGHARQPREPRW